MIENLRNIDSSYAKSAGRMGRRRTLLPVATKMALPTAGAGRFRARHNVNLDYGRRFVHAKHFVVMKVALLNASAFDGDGTLQRLRQPKIDGAFHLCFNSERVDGSA